VLDRELAEVARRHPNDLAVRKIEVIDADSPAWTHYLAPGRFDLPHVKLFDRDGKLVWERSGSPAALAAGVDDAITGAHVGAAPALPAAADPGRIAITVTDAGFEPSTIEIPRGRRVTLVVTRTSERTCAVDIHLALPDGTDVSRRLPLGAPVEIPLEIDRAGEVPFACGMNMVHGKLVVK
jgi:hypothetical protein